MRKTINTKHFDIDIDNQWSAIFNRKDYNWVDFDIIKLSFEDNKHLGCWETELYLLGFGIRLYGVYNEEVLSNKLKEWKLDEN